MLKFIESDKFPLAIIARDAAIEMSFKPRGAYYARCKELGIPYKGRFYDPKIRNIHPWLARRPRSASRALTYASLIPYRVPQDDFLKEIGFEKDRLIKLTQKGYPPLISYSKPYIRRDLSKITLIDPMAGGGSIPLEASILGIGKVIAIDYNPVAYLILRATIEFPSTFGMELYKAVQSEARKFISYMKNQLRNYYRSNDDGYIIVRQVKMDENLLPLQDVIPLSKGWYAEIMGDNILIKKGTHKPTRKSRKELIPMWIKQYIKAIKDGDIDAYIGLNKYIVLNSEGEFEEYDNQYIYKTFEELDKIQETSLSKYRLYSDNKVFSDILELKTFDKIFNVRQLLALQLAISYIRKLALELHDTKGLFGAAVALYLAFGVNRMADFNSILTSWNYRTKTVRDSMGGYYKYRKFKLENIYAESTITNRTLEWIFEPDTKTETSGGICPVLYEMVTMLEDSKTKIEIYLGDATKMEHFISPSSIDIVHVDPPYYDVHYYGDFSEFFWFLLHSMLEPVFDSLIPKKSIKINWSPNMKRVPKKEEIIAHKGYRSVYEQKMIKTIRSIYNVLKEDGIFLIWFAHRKMEAWDTLINAIERNNFIPTNIIPLASEHPTRSITKGGMTGFNRALVIVARKKDSLNEKINPEILLDTFEKYLKQAKIMPNEKILDAEVEIMKKAVEKLLKKCYYRHLRKT